MFALGVSSFPNPGTTQTENYLQTGTLNARPDRNATALAALRIAVGALFLLFAQYKVFGTQFTLGGGFQTWINRFLAEGVYPFMVPFLRNFVLPHGTAIAFLVAYGELAIGLALVLGVLVRTASACGIIFMLTLLFSSNFPGTNAPFWQYFGAALDHLVLALCFATFALGDSAKVLSLRSIRRATPKITPVLRARMIHFSVFSSVIRSEATRFFPSRRPLARRVAQSRDHGLISTRLGTPNPVLASS